MLAVSGEALHNPNKHKDELDELCVLWSKHDVLVHFLQYGSPQSVSAVWSMYESNAFTLSNISTGYPNVALHQETVEFLLSSERLSEWINTHTHFTRRELEKTQAWIDHATIPPDHRERLGVDVLHCLQLEILDKKHTPLNLRDTRLIDVAEKWLTKTLFSVEHIQHTNAFISAIFPFPEWYSRCKPRIPWMLSKAVLLATVPETLPLKKILVRDRYSRRYKLLRVEDPDTCWGYADFAMANAVLNKRIGKTFESSRYNTFVLPDNIVSIVHTFDCPDLLGWLNHKQPGSFEDLQPLSSNVDISFT